MSRRPPPKITYKDNWMCDLDSDIVGNSKDTQRIKPKPKTQLSSTERPACGEKEEIEERTKFDHDTLNQEKQCEVTDSTRTVRPVLVDQKEEHGIDFRVPGLSHAVVKEAEHLRAQELVKKIENYPHREALHADLQQNSVYNPPSKNSKEMIREWCNVELFELCETIPKVQCSLCLLFWNQGIVCCTCGQCLIDSESTRKPNKLTLDALSIPNYVKKKGHNHGARHGKTKEQTLYHMAWNGRDAARKFTLKVIIVQVFTIAVSEIQFIVNHNSQSYGQSKIAKSVTNLQKKTIQIISLQRKRKDTKDNGTLP